MTRDSQQFRTDGGQYADGADETASVGGTQTTETLTGRVDFTDADAERLTALADLDVSASTVAEYTGERVSTTHESALADHLASLSAGPSTQRTQQTASLVEESMDAGHSPATVVAPYAAVFDQVLDDVFDELADGLDPEDAQARIRATLRASLVDAQAAVDAAAGTARQEHADTDASSGRSFGVEQLLDTLPIPAFIVDADHRVVGWNDGSSYLLQMDESDVLGEHTAESIKKGSASDKTLADKVVDSPYRAHEEYDIDRIETPYTECLVYEDTGVATDVDGNEIHVEYKAMPMFDDGELLGVFEMYQDRTEAVQRQQAMEGLVNEITVTLEAISSGTLSARCSFDDEHDIVDAELLAIVDEVNEMATEFERLVDRVDEKTSDLSTSIRSAAESAEEINEEITDQTTSIDEVAGEMESFSATMEEVAATADDVSNAATRTRREATDGLDAGHRAREATDEVSEMSEDLVATVDELDDHMSDIGEVVEVIADIADQTNMLALNANIEAARAGEAGSGFAVVADEVKELADETQSHTTEISQRIETIERLASQTVTAVEALHGDIETTEAEIDETLAALENIADSADSAASGIEEVADANDQQAATVEEVTATLDQINEHTDEVEATADAIVTEMATQESDIEELAERVDELSE